MDLSNNKLSDDTAALLVNSLMRKPALHTLDLGRNDAGRASAKVPNHIYYMYIGLVITSEVNTDTENSDCVFTCVSIARTNAWVFL